MKEKIKIILKYILIFIIMIFCYYFSMQLVSMFSTDYVADNVNDSIDILLKEGKRPESTLADNYTDAIILDESYSMNSKTPVYSGMLVLSGYDAEINRVINQDPVGERKSPTILDLKDLLENKSYEAEEYGKYWHGNLIIYRPLLVLTNYEGIRIIQLIVELMLAVILIRKIYEKTGIFEAIAFIIGLIATKAYFIYLTMSFSPVFIIMLVFSIFLISRYEKIKNKGLMFFVVGSLTCFFDFLTFPVITLGVPLIICMLMDRESTSKKKVLNIVKYSLLWGISFSLTWLAKFLIVDFIFERNLLETAFNQFKYRTSSVNYLATVWENICTLDWYSICACVVFLISYVIVFKLYNRKQKLGFKKKNIIEYLVIFAIPFAWYFVLGQHSFKHVFIAYRNLIISLIALQIIFIELFNKRDMKIILDKNLNIEFKKSKNQGKIKEDKN